MRTPRVGDLVYIEIAQQRGIARLEGQKFDLSFFDAFLISGNVTDIKKYRTIKNTFIKAILPDEYYNDYSKIKTLNPFTFKEDFPEYFL